MATLRILSAVEQVAAHLRVEITQGTFDENLPGVSRLADDLGVNHKTVAGALELLQDEGLILTQGPRRKRIVALQNSSGPRPMRIGILLYEPSDREFALFVEMQHALMEAGHTVSYARKTLTELGMDLPKVAKLVTTSKADAWIVIAGSKNILEWFSSYPKPAFALFGRRSNVPLASVGPSTDSAITQAVAHLVAQGHRRIVKICRGERRKPHPGKTERAFLAALASHGISTGEYNLPDWEESIEGLQALLRSLFLVTPPTALILEESYYFIAVVQFMAKHDIHVPDDVSLICLDSDPHLRWCQPSVAQIDWDQGPALRRIIRWASLVSHKKSDQKCSNIPARFIPGDTIGPASPSEGLLRREKKR